MEAASSADSEPSTRRDPSPAVVLPLVITIGPQCSGKTTYLRKYPRIKDVSIDDVPGVYEKVAIEALISSEYLEMMPDANVYKRSMKERIMEVQGQEQGLIAQRIFGMMTAEQFAYFVRPLVQDSTACAFLCEVLEELLLQNPTLTNTVDIFIPEARAWGVRAAQGNLKKALADSTCAVGWGNTNLSSREYRTALRIAHDVGRPVEFACWGREIPKVEPRELVRRNVSRFIRTGKYIPVDIIVGYVQRAEQLLRTTREGEPAELARSAGFTLLESGLVQPNTPVAEPQELARNKSAPEVEGDEEETSRASSSSTRSDSGLPRGSEKPPRRHVVRHRRRRERSHSPRADRR